MPPVSQAAASIDGGDDAWQESVALERAVAAADWQCRADIYASGVGRVSTELPQFETRFSEQLAAVSNDWADVLATADRPSEGGCCAACRAGG